MSVQQALALVLGLIVGGWFVWSMTLGLRSPQYDLRLIRVEMEGDGRRVVGIKRTGSRLAHTYSASSARVARQYEVEVEDAYGRSTHQVEVEEELPGAAGAVGRG